MLPDHFSYGLHPRAGWEEKRFSSHPASVSFLIVGVEALRLPHLDGQGPRGGRRGQVPLTTIGGRIGSAVGHPHIDRAGPTQVLGTASEGHGARATPLSHPGLPRRTETLAGDLAVGGRQRQPGRTRRHGGRHRPGSRRRRHRLMSVVSTTGGGISTAFHAALAKVPPSTGGTGG